MPAILPGNLNEITSNLTGPDSENVKRGLNSTARIRGRVSEMTSN